MQRSQLANLQAIKRKGSGLLGGIMGGFASGGSAAPNPEYANLAKYGELGNVAGDSSIQPFIKAGPDLFGQSTRAANDLNNQVVLNNILAQQRDAMARAMLPFQTNEATRGAVDVARQTGAITDERETAKREQLSAEEGTMLGQGLGALSDKEAGMLLPNNKSFTSPQEQGNVIKSLYPQIGAQGFKGVLAKLPEQNANFNFSTSPEGEKDLAKNAKIEANKPLLSARKEMRMGNYQPNDPLNMAGGGFEATPAANKIISREVPIPQTDLEKAAGAPIRYMKEQQDLPIPAQYRVIPPAVTQEELNGVAGATYRTPTPLGTPSRSAMLSGPGVSSDQTTITASGVSTPFSENPPTGVADKPPVPQVIAQPQPGAGTTPSPFSGTFDPFTFNENLGGIPNAVAPAIKATGNALSKIPAWLLGGGPTDAMSQYVLQPGAKAIGKIGRAGLEGGDNLIKNMLNSNPKSFDEYMKETQAKIEDDKKKKKKIGMMPAK